MKYDEVKLPPGKKALADLAVVTIMLVSFATVAFSFEFFMTPVLGRKKAIDIFMFLVLIPSFLGGAALGKYLVYKHLKKIGLVNAEAGDIK